MRTAAACLIALAILVLGLRIVHADGHGPLLSGYTMTSWTLADGVPLGPVHAITQDADGFLWLGTATGVVRFDGARFTPWDTMLSTPPARTEVFALALGRDGTLWVGFGRLGGAATVAALRNGVLTTVSKGDAPRQATNWVLPDRAGRVWAVSGGVLYRLQHGQWRAVREGGLGDAEIISVREDVAGALWIGTRQGLFRSPDGKAFERVDAGISRETSQGGDGALWITDPAHGARRLGVRSALDLEGLGAHLLHDSQSNLWVATSGQGLFRVRDTGGSQPPLIERASVQTGLASNTVQSLLEDREGNVWVGTMQGLHSLTPQELTPVAAGALVRAMLPEADGSMLVGTADGLLQYRREGGVWRGTTVDRRFGLRALYRDASGRGWATTDAGLRAVVDGRLVAEPVAPSGEPLCSAGAVVTVPSGPPPRCASRDALWVAVAGGTLTVRRGDSVRTVASATVSGDSGRSSIDAIFEDSQGVVWAGGTSGLVRVRGSAVDHIGEREGLPAQRVMGITQSRDGFLWLAVDRGPRYPGRRAAVVRVDPAAVDRALATRTSIAGPVIYDAGHGLAGIPLTPVSAARSGDGTLWFAFGGGLTVVDPARVQDGLRRASAVARVVGARVDDRPVVTSGAGEIPAGTRRVQIDYTAIRLTAPGQIRFRYRVDGFDPQWIDVGPRRQALYTNLSPGHYVFRVQANGDGTTWTSSAEWPFEVRPAFHQTPWFYAIGGVALLVVAWGVAHTRVWLLNRQFAAALAERMRLSREIHDTMLQSLVGIALQVQAISRGCAPEAAEQRSLLVALRQQVEEYIREVRQAIQNLRSPMLEARGLAGALSEIGRRLVAPPTRFDVESDQVVAAPAASEGELLRIAQEAIANAARHAGAAHIRVDLRQERKAVRLRVTDDGRGFDVDATLRADDGHYGLKGMQERARRIGARLTVTSSAAGTVVEAIAPCTRRYA